MDIPDIYLIAVWALIAFGLSKAIIPVLLLIAKKKHLFDDGDKDHRKLHDGLVPTLGGVAIFTAFIISFSASSFADDIPGYGYFVSASCILFAAGLKDDIIVISPIKKLAAQVAAAALIIFGCGLHFDHLGGVFGIQAISPWIGIPLTFFTIIVVTNAFNLIDGVDGLGGSFAILVIGFLGSWFYQAGLVEFATLSIIFIGSVAGFMWYNWFPAKIFMGDTGSLYIGFLSSVLAIYVVKYAAVLPEVVFWQPAAPIVAAAVMAVPLYDTLRVFILRVLNGTSPFEADQDHIHHHLLRIGLNHIQTVSVLIFLNVAILGIVLAASNYLKNTGLFFLLIGSCVLLLPTNRFKRKIFKFMVPSKWIVQRQDSETEKESKIDQIDPLESGNGSTLEGDEWDRQTATDKGKKILDKVLEL
jgi:UDP-N-acetylmuramyl pentapeptide phosphotransferase/UDP-N-acetylglucosamine-1-phosphate transferase